MFCYNTLFRSSTVSKRWQVINIKSIIKYVPLSFFMFSCHHLLDFSKLLTYNSFIWHGFETFNEFNVVEQYFYNNGSGATNSAWMTLYKMKSCCVCYIRDIMISGQSIQESWSPHGGIVYEGSGNHDVE